MYIWSMVTFPGFVNDDSLDQFFQWAHGPWYKTTHFFQLIMINGSTIFAMFALFTFFRASKEIEKCNTNVCLNKRSLVLHLLLLILITVVSSAPLLRNRNSLYYIVLTITDMILQLTICYICLTMGSNAQLRKFRVTLEVN